jgi:hypothetical protein
MVLLGDDNFPEAKRGTTNVAPHIVVGVDHSECTSRDTLRF